MANRITHDLNNALNESFVVSDFYTRRYLSAFRLAGCMGGAEPIASSEIDMYYRVYGYELYDDRDHNRKAMEDLSRHMINMLGSMRQCFSYTLYSTVTGIGVYLGTNHQNAALIKQALNGNICNVSVKNEWISRNSLANVQRHNGLIVGACAIEQSDIDKIISTFSGTSFTINFVCVPCSTAEMDDEVHKVDCYLDAFQKVSRTELSVGSQRTRRMDNDNHDILDVIDVITKEKKKLQKCAVNGAWQVMVHAAAAEPDVYVRLSAALVALFKSRSAPDIDNVSPIAVQTGFPAVDQSTWYFPRAFLGSKDLGGAYGNSLMNLLDSNTVATLVLLPLFPHEGYSVKHLGESGVSKGAFDRFAPDVQDGDAFVLGELTDGGKYDISINEFRQHAFVTGASQYGKSTTVRKVISEAYKRNIPFTVIEAAKKDYWKLTESQGLKDVAVYSVGMDARNLYMNPFQPEENTRLEFHIQSLIHALLSMFDQGDPLPQILTNLVYLCYEKKGWQTSGRTTRDTDLEYPILSDILDHLDDCVDAIGYSEDVKNDMKGVVRIRISSLIRQVGALFNTQCNISIRDMFASSAIIELDDFDDESKPFIASLLAIKVNEYSRQCEMEGKLRRLLVVEEAHHILPNPELRSASPNSMKCSKYFSNMLAEVSAYGTGMIIVDQRASAISSAALANTGVKIVHNIREGEDIETIARSMSLKEYERGLLNRLKVGQAIVALPQADEVCRVNIDGRSARDPSVHIGCLFCRRRECRDWSDRISQFETNYLKGNGVNVHGLKQCIESISNRCMLDLFPDDKLCLAGSLCAAAMEGNELICRQRLYDYVASIRRMCDGKTLRF